MTSMVLEKNRSCESQLISLIDDLVQNNDVGCQTDLILLDFAKAFDKVNHLSLLKKISHYGIRNNTLNWIKDFLLNRTQQVSMEGTFSEAAPVLSGVPQGTVLGPLLFLLYINDLPQYVSRDTSVRLFADDSALYRKIKSPEDHTILQQDILSLQQWETDWSMNFHPEKCQLIQITTKRKPSNFIYTIHNVIIGKIEDAKYLGININNKLSWNGHINNICKKAHNSLNFIHRNFKTCSPKIKKNLYLAYVRPSVEYCCSVWDPHTTTNITKLEGVQRRAARFIKGEFSREVRVTPMLQELNLVPLQERRARTKTTILYKALNGLIDIPTDHLHRTIGITRQCQNFRQPHSHTNSYLHSFYPSTIRLWNKTPLHVRNAPSLLSFQNQLSAVTLCNQY